MTPRRGATVRLIRSGALHPQLNMALDQALDPEEPALRLYRFSPPGLSLGYFQRAAGFSPQMLRERGWVLVRRETGGAAICHDGDVTFSFVARPDHPLFAGDVAASYYRIHDAVAHGLRGLGVIASAREDLPAASDDAAGDVVCFHRATRFDLVADARKIVGSAQRRTRDRVLHHGSVPVRANPLAVEAACIDRLVGRAVPFEDVEDALIQGFGDRLGVCLEAATPSATETARATELARERYGSADWTHRR